MRYPVTITPDDEQFTVTFPDVPEAVTLGGTREEALQRAPEALLTVFDAFMKDRRDIPAPSASTGDVVELPALETAKLELYRTMRRANIGKAELARRLNWHLPQVDRVLQVKHGSQLEQMEAAFAALGKKLVILIEDDDPIAAPAKRGSVAAANYVMKKAARRGVHPGVLRRQARAVRTQAGASLSGRHRTVARKASKKR